MEPYRRIYRRKVAILEPLPEELTEWKPAHSPESLSELCSEEELRRLGQLGEFGMGIISSEWSGTENCSMGFD